MRNYFIGAVVLALALSATSAHAMMSRDPDGTTVGGGTINTTVISRAPAASMPSMTAIDPLTGAKRLVTSAQLSALQKAIASLPLPVQGVATVQIADPVTGEALYVDPNGLAKVKVAVAAIASAKTATAVAAPAQASIVVDPPTVDAGAKAKLSWASVGVDTCKVSWNDGTKDVTKNGASNQGIWISPVNQGITFSMHCTGPNNATAEAQATVAVNVPVDAPTVTAIATPAVVDYGAPANISWTVDNAKTCSVYQGTKLLGTADASSTQGIPTGPLTKATSFKVSCSGDGGTGTDGTTVDVNPAPAPTVSITAVPTTVDYNKSAKISWSSADAKTCAVTRSDFTLENDSAVDEYGVDGPVTHIKPLHQVHGPWKSTLTGDADSGALTEDVTFAISCSGPGGASDDSVTVKVNPAPSPTITIKSDPSAVDYGAPAKLTWSSENAQSCSVAGDNGFSKKGTSADGVSTGALTKDLNLTITCQGYGATEPAVQTLTVSVNPPVKPTVDISAAPSVVDYGASSKISWNSQNASACAVTRSDVLLPLNERAIGLHGPNSWADGLSGTQDAGVLTRQVTFTVRCTGAANLSADKAVTVTVNPPPVPTATLSVSKDSVTNGSTVLLSWSSVGATACALYANGKTLSSTDTHNDGLTSSALPASTVFGLVCSGPGGSVAKAVVVQVAPAIATISPMPSVTVTTAPSATPSSGGGGGGGNLGNINVFTGHPNQPMNANMN